MNRARAVTLLLLAGALFCAAGCDRARGQATRDAARCEDLRTTGDSGAVDACKVEVVNGCTAFGAEDPFCGMAHIHLALALGGAGSDPDWSAIAAELASGERILCNAGGRWAGECAQATSLRQRFAGAGGTAH